MSKRKLKRIQIELTSLCNERCVHCYIPHNGGNRHMDSGLLAGILDQCAEMGLQSICFTGGEPMLHPGFLDAVNKADRYGWKIRIFSNLLLLDEAMLSALKAWRIQEVQASLYSTEGAIHDAITRTPGSCENTKQGIIQLVENKIPVFISCPVTKLNKDSYPGVLAYAKRLGVGTSPTNMIFARSNHDGGNLHYRLDMDEALKVIQDILDNDTAYDDERFLPGYDNPDEALPCVQNICTDSICINANGEVTPLPGWNKVLGDLKRQSLREIWENSSELKAVHSITIDDFPHCRSCPDIQFCGMGLESNANENPQGDHFAIPEHTCVLAEATRRLVHSWHKSKAAV